MLDNKLITREEIRDYTQISKTFSDDMLNDTIIQVQLNEIRPLLGDELFNDLMSNASEHEDLLNGSTYTYNSVTYTNYGLKAVLSYYIYAYSVMFGDVINTPFGSVQKLNNLSEPVPNDIRKSMFTINKQSAYNVWLSVKDFLVRTDYPKYNTNRFCQKTKTNFNIRKIGK